MIDNGSSGDEFNILYSDEDNNCGTAFIRQGNSDSDLKSSIY